MKKNNLAKNTTLLLVATAMNKGIMLFAAPLFSRWLTTEEYGQFDVYASYLSLLIPIVTLACGEAVFRFGIEHDDKDEKSIYVTNGFVVTISGILIFLAIISFFVNKNSYTMLFAIYAAMDMFAEYLLGFMRSVRKISYYTFCSVLSTCLVFLFVFIFVRVLELGLSGMLLAYATSIAIKNVLMICVTRFPSFVNFKTVNRPTILKMTRYSVMLVLSNISWWIVNVSDRWLINIFLGATSNGIYAASCKIPNLIASFSSMFSISWQEAAVDEVDSDRRNTYFDGIYNKMLVFMLTAAGCLLACSYWMFGWFFDYRYIEGKFYSPILIASSVLHAMVYFFNGINISLKRPKSNSICVFTGAVLNFLINFVFIRNIGLYAAALSTLISNCVIFIMMLFSLRKFYRPKHIKTTIFCLLIFAYFFVAQYIFDNLAISIVNLIASVIIFFAINRKFIMSKIKPFFNKIRP